jgi:hypothetical protein
MADEPSDKPTTPGHPPQPAPLTPPAVPPPAPPPQPAYPQQPPPYGQPPPYYGQQPGYGQQPYNYQPTFQPGPYPAGPYPYGYQPPYQAPVRRGIGCVGLTLILLGLVLVVVIGGAVAMFMGVFTPNQLLNLVGQGPAYVEVDNMRDRSITADLVVVGGDGETTRSADLESFDLRTLTAGGPGLYRLTVSDSSGDSIARCTMEIGGGNQWQFVVLPETVLVVLNEQTPSRSEDLFVETSRLCEAGGT